MPSKKREYFSFVKRLLIFAVILFAVDFLLGKCIGFLYFKMEKGNTARITYVMTKAKEDIVVFGSSRANHHYVPSFLEDSFHVKTYNAGMDGQSMPYYYCVLKAIQSRTHPKIVILDLNLDEFELSETGYNRLSALLPYYYLIKDIQPVINLRGPYEKLKSVSNLYRYNSFILPAVVNNIVKRKDDSEKGYVPLSKELSSDTKPLVDALKNYTLDTLKVSLFKSFIKDATAKGSKVFVFISPMFRIQQAMTPTVSKAMAICKEENIPFVDFGQSSLFIAHPEYFQNSSHLNSKGADIYTRMICSEIRSRM
jgi:hypothetical protein